MNRRKMLGRHLGSVIVRAGVAKVAFGCFALPCADAAAQKPIGRPESASDRPLKIGAGDGFRTRDLLLGKEALYH